LIVGGLDYLLPEEYVYTMKELHNNAPESKISELFETIETDFKCKVLNKMFKVNLKQI
jgi:aarF domain-containing kinase